MKRQVTTKDLSFLPASIITSQWRLINRVSIVALTPSLTNKQFHVEMTSGRLGSQAGKGMGIPSIKALSAEVKFLWLLPPQPTQHKTLGIQKEQNISM